MFTKCHCLIFPKMPNFHYFDGFLLVKNLSAVKFILFWRLLNQGLTVLVTSRAVLAKPAAKNENRTLWITVARTNGKKSVHVIKSPGHDSIFCVSQVQTVSKFVDQCTKGCWKTASISPSVSKKHHKHDTVWPNWF